MQKFPLKLHAILSDPNLEDMITWLPNGRSWRVVNREKFEKEVIPLYFRHRNYSSFMRQVNGWGFRRVDYRDTFQHEFFQKDTQLLCMKMRRLHKNTRKDSVVAQPCLRMAEGLAKNTSSPLGQSYVDQFKTTGMKSQHSFPPFDSSIKISNHNDIIPGQSVSIVKMVNHDLYPNKQTDLSNQSLRMESEQDMALRLVQNNFELNYLQFQEYCKMVAQSKMRLQLGYKYDIVNARALNRLRLLKMIRVISSQNIYYNRY